MQHPIQITKILLMCLASVLLHQQHAARAQSYLLAAHHHHQQPQQVAPFGDSLAGQPATGTPPQAPSIIPFSFNQNVQENQRAMVMCTTSSGENPVSYAWLKDGQLLTASLAQARRITIKPDQDASTLKIVSVRLDHAGNYTCVAKNRLGSQAHSAQLIVHGEPRWLKEPQHEPIVATRGQTVVIDCQTTGWPRPQQSWQIKSEYIIRHIIFAELLFGRFVQFFTAICRPKIQACQQLTHTHTQDPPTSSRKLGDVRRAVGRHSPGPGSPWQPLAAQGTRARAKPLLVARRRQRPTSVGAGQHVTPSPGGRTRPCNTEPQICSPDQLLTLVLPER